ncbi:hypothetical protein [Aliivibrio fischeri]|uniref:hypothetical protein n=1 Tax=Aliivibrio fischeri TaxID=668 RepID=UPI00105CAFF3|nr:hypothetical protein [Aliivibrio fischeri]TDM51399.1 hypothetical protein VFFQA001_14835 [Aliivibrio fischeri]
MSHVENIIKVLDEVVEDSKSNSWCDGDWTREIKNRLCNLGKEKRYWTYASAENSDGGEWLYDVTWLTYSNNRLLNTELILESEWDMNGIDFDFQKLLLAKSELKSLIFQQKSGLAAQHKIEDLISQINKYSKTTSDEEYLFSCWLQDERQFFHSKYRT